MLSFHLSSVFINKVKALPSPFIGNAIGEIVYRKTYARTKENGQKEQWWETVERVVNGTYTLQKNHIEKQGLGWNEEQAQASAQEMYQLIFDMKFSPPGRGLWVMGTDIVHKKGLGMALNNCSFVSTEDIDKDDPAKPFKFLMDVSMLGVGCGADTKGRNLIHIHPPHIIDPPLVYTIDDTREGWVDSVAALLNSYFNEGRPRLTFDYSKIRKEGERLKTFGGVSSGPGPLIELHESLTTLLDKKSLLDSTTIVDIFNLIGKAVVSGNIRRCIPKGTLVHTYNRGLVPIECIQPNVDHTATASGSKPITDLLYQGSQELVTVHTELGPFSVSLEHKIKMSDGKFKRAKYLSRGDSVLYSKHFVTTGSPVDPSHCWFYGYCLIGHTSNKDIYYKLREVASSLGFKTDNESMTFEAPVYDYIKIIEKGDYNARAIFLDAVEEANNRSPRLLHSNLPLLKRLQVLYASINRLASVQAMECCGSYCLEFYPDVGTKNHPVNVLALEFSGEVDECYDLSVEDTHEFVIGPGVYVSNSAEIMFGEVDDPDFLELKNYEKNPHRATYGWTSNNSIIANIGMDYKEVAERIRVNGEPGLAWLESMRAYSRLVDPPDNKDFKVMGGNPCLEQSLESYEVCCLVETFPARHNTLCEYLRTLKFAYLYAKTVTLEPTNWIESTRVVMRNRRIGCSISGIARFLSKHNIDTLKQWLESGYKTIQYWDRIYSDWLCIPRSIKTTSVKPSGTVSLLADEPPGVHFPNSTYYYRRIRVANTDPILKELEQSGYHIEPCFGSETTTSVVRIPKFVGEGVRTLDDSTMWEQLGLAAFMQRYWADNQVSCTVTFNPVTEGPHIEAALDIYQYQLKGISFLPRCDGVYPQMPYEKISKEVYEQEILNILENKTIPIRENPGNFPSTTCDPPMPEGIMYCDGDMCQI